jgi:8-oxo-dGTP pyrophosphatase MutT (NUDIX family)
MVAEASASAVILLREDGAALMQHRDNIPGLPHAGKWTPPGGHCEEGESEEECARREFLEETGYRCDILHELSRFWDDHVPGAALWLKVFWAVYDGRQPVACQEGQALEFLPRADAGRYPIPGYLVDLWDRALAAAAATVARG